MKDGLKKLGEETEKAGQEAKKTEKDYQKLRVELEKYVALVKEGKSVEAAKFLEQNAEVAKVVRKLRKDQANLTKDNFDILKSVVDLEWSDAIYKSFEKVERNVKEGAKTILMIMDKTEEEAEILAEKLPHIVSGGLEAFWSAAETSPLVSNEKLIQETASSYVRGYKRSLEAELSKDVENIQALLDKEDGKIRKKQIKQQKSEEERRREGQKLWALTIEDAIKGYEDQYGALWKFTEDGKNTYKAYFNVKRKLYKDDAEGLAEIQKESNDYEYELLKHSQQKKEVLKEQSFQFDKLELKKQLAEGLITQETYAQREEELTIKYLEEQISLRNSYGEEAFDLENQLADMRIAIKEREASQAEAISQAEQKKAEATLKKQQEGIKEAGKNIANLGKEVSTPWLSSALDGMGKMMEKFSSKFKKKNEENTESAEQAAQAQGDAFNKIAREIAEYSEILVSMTGALFSKQNEMLAQEIEAAQEKYEALSAKYDEAVEKRKESDEELQSLEEQAKSARGGRLLYIQGQIDAEMAKNKELSDQEKKLQADKDKTQKDIEKKQKQQKKNDLKQQMITSVANVATGATMAMAQWGFPLGIINAAILGATGALQVAAIGKQMSKLQDGGLLNGRLHRDGGMRIEGTNIEVEGGEYVVNRDSTRKNMGLIRYINSQRRELDGDDLHNFFSQPSHTPFFASSFAQMMEQGGEVPMMPTQVDISNSDLLGSIQNIKFEPRVAVTDIHAVQGQMTQVDEWVGM